MAFVGRTLGLLAVVLGLAGVLGSVALAVTIWQTGSAIIQTPVEVVVQVDTAVELARERARRSARRVLESKQAVEDSQQRLAQWAAGGARIDGPSLLKLQELRQRWALATQQAEEWLEIVTAAADLLDQLLELTSSAGVELEGPARRLAELLRAVQAAEKSLDEASTWLDGLIERIATGGGNADLAEDVRKADHLMGQIATNLDGVSQGLQAFERSLVGGQTRLRQLRTSTLRWFLAGQIVATALCTWMAVAQLSLFVHGFRIVRRRAN